jgi:hypothetical protein
MNRAVVVVAAHALADLLRLKQSRFTSIPAQAPESQDLTVEWAEVAVYVSRLLVLAIPSAENAPNMIAVKLMSFRIFSFTSFPESNN